MSVVVRVPNRPGLFIETLPPSRMNVWPEVFTFSCTLPAPVTWIVGWLPAVPRLTFAWAVPEPTVPVSAAPAGGPPAGVQRVASFQTALEPFQV